MVEDEERLAGLLRRALEREGYAVDVAPNGLEALWYGRENEYDAIVLDVMIPAAGRFRGGPAAARRRPVGPRADAHGS